MTRPFDRRNFLAAVPAAATLLQPEEAQASNRSEPFRYCLNTSTLRGQHLPLAQEVDIAARAGYQGIEPWVFEIADAEKSGGSVKDLTARIRDRGLVVESAIAFPEWCVDDDGRRARALDEAKRAMDFVARLGGTRIAAPPAGATEGRGLELRRLAERYRALLEIGERMGVVPQVEVWGFSATLTTLDQAAFVAVGSDHPAACVLPDVYHLYKGGSGFEGLRLLSGTAMHVIHVNDYPAEPDREHVTDAHRVYPGDGVAPLPRVFRALREGGFRGALSLELFNREYWKQDPAVVARTGLKRTREAVRRTFAG